MANVALCISNLEIQRVFLLTHSLAHYIKVNMKKIISFIAVAMIALLPISNANAETAWRYWSYWQLTDGQWEMAMTGAADVKAEDGQVQGWRYITAGMEITEDFAPRTEATFETICANVPAKDGIARVALVVDFGDATDYSNEQDASAIQEVTTACVKLNEGDPSSLLLGSAFETREESGMVCAVNNLPSSGCGEEVELPAATEEPLTTSAIDEEGEESSKLPFLGLAALAVVAAFFVLKNRKQN